MSLLSRLAFAFVCWFRVLVDPDFAARALLVRDGLPPAPPPPPTPPEPVKVAEPPPVAARPSEEIAGEGALRLLGVLQREGRLIDFLEEDVASFSDADVGAAARVVHDGCRQALRGQVELGALRTEAEGAAIEIPAGYDPGSIKLTGNVKGSGPFRGALRHRGWQARSIKLPVLLPGADPTILTPAEVEL
jgi:hypothetical protein